MPQSHTQHHSFIEERVVNFLTSKAPWFCRLSGLHDNLSHAWISDQGAKVKPLKNTSLDDDDDDDDDDDEDEDDDDDDGDNVGEFVFYHRQC